jgi:hypothetical protein
MPLTPDPQAAGNIAVFGGRTDSRAATVNFDLPLSGGDSFQRVIPLEIPDDRFNDAAHNAGVPLADLGVVPQDPASGIRSVDATQLQILYDRILSFQNRPQRRAAASLGADVVVTNTATPPGGAQPSVQMLVVGTGGWGMSAGPAGSTGDTGDTTAGPVIGDALSAEQVRRSQFIANLAQLQDATLQRMQKPPTSIDVPTSGVGQSVRTVPADTRQAGTPRLAVIETWTLTAFLGDYGLGRTLNTFSLLPGERTTITVDTWSSSTETREDSSSIFDSSDEAAQTRFTSALESQSGSAFQDQGSWALSIGAKAKASFDVWFASASLEIDTNFSANHQTARQEFSSSVARSSQEHASQVNASRRQTVSAASSTTVASGASQTVVREIANTNLRRVLNFVFRELNQSYETKISLSAVRVGFYNGNVDSGDVAPLSELRQFLAKYVQPEFIEQTARQLLAGIVQAVDFQGVPQTMLQVGSLAGGVFSFEDAALNDQGELDFEASPVDPEFSWRIKPGPIGQSDKDPHQVPGVLMSADNTVLRTDNVIAEALLGQADALDPYATALQVIDLAARQADVDFRNAGTRRTTAALDLVGQQAADKQVDAFDKVLGDKPEIEIVPAAATAGNGQP